MLWWNSLLKNHVYVLALVHVSTCVPWCLFFLLCIKRIKEAFCQRKMPTRRYALKVKNDPDDLSATPSTYVPEAWQLQVIYNPIKRTQWSFFARRNGMIFTLCFLWRVFLFFLGGTRHLEAAVLLQNHPLKKFVRRCLTSWPWTWLQSAWTPPL